MAAPALILRPYGIVLSGALELGLEVVLEDGVIQEVRPHTGVPEDYVLSPAFVNAHSHLEYRGLMGKVKEPEYWGWIRELTRLKQAQSPEEVRADCYTAAQENIRTGVALILEHSDRPFAGEAIRKSGLQGAIEQEVITVLETDPDHKLEMVEEKARRNQAAFGGPVFLNPHAYQTVDSVTLRRLAELATPLSIHVAETPYESELTRHGIGPIADFYRANGVPIVPTGKGVLQSLDDLGLVREDTQLVHCCALEDGDLELISKRGAVVAHCPRSNQRLQCPSAPIAEMLEAGIKVGLGLDSAASSGPIDMFAEMRAALEVGLTRGRPVSPEQVWNMATTLGYASIRHTLPKRQDWAIVPGSYVPLLKLHVAGAQCTEELIERCEPGKVGWVYR